MRKRVQLNLRSIGTAPQLLEIGRRAVEKELAKRMEFDKYATVTTEEILKIGLTAIANYIDGYAK